MAESESHRAQQRAEVLYALTLAAAEAPQIMQLACASSTSDGFNQALMEAFGVSKIQAIAIGNMQIRRFHEDAQGLLRNELADITERPGAPES